MAVGASQNRSFKEGCQVIVVGAGLAGLGTAIGIRRAGLQVLVLEQAAEIREVHANLLEPYNTANYAQQIGAGIEIPPNSAHVLAKWGILEPLKLTALNVRDMKHHSYRDGSLFSKINLDPYCEQHYCAPHLCVHRVDFHTCLLQEAKRLGVLIKLDAGIIRIDFTKPAVISHSGEVYKADLVLGADGQRSICRNELLGHPDPPRHSGDLVYRILLKSNDMRQREDLREMLDPLDFHIWSGPGGHAISYALKRDDEYNIVLTQPDQSVDQVEIEPKAADVVELRALFEEWDPKIKALLDVATEISKWTLFDNSDLTTWTHPDGKFALVGDAAHAMFPFLWVTILCSPECSFTVIPAT